MSFHPEPPSQDELQSEQIKALLQGQVDLARLAQQMAEIVLAHQAIVRRHAEDEPRFGRIEATLIEVREVLGTVAALKGGLRVMGWLGTFAKWLAAIAAAGLLLLAALKFLLTHTPPPR